jgi:predicted nuclease of predicted toxin-antitoxin system
VSVRFYCDENVHGAITEGLRRRGVDVLTAQDDGRRRAADPRILDRAGELGRVLFTQDEDLLAEAHRRQEHGEPFIGVIYGHQLNATVGQYIRDPELIAQASDPEEYANRVQYLPF